MNDHWFRWWHRIPLRTHVDSFRLLRFDEFGDDNWVGLNDDWIRTNDDWLRRWNRIGLDLDFARRRRFSFPDDNCRWGFRYRIRLHMAFNGCGFLGFFIDNNWR